MELLKGLLKPFEVVNGAILPVTRALAVAAVAVMVIVTLLQIFLRYVLGNSLSWPPEAARFCMLWMTGLMAPTAFRRGGFVAIDMLEMALPRRASAILTLVLLVVCMLVLGFAVRLGWDHVNSGWLFASSSLKIPLGLVGYQDVPIKLAWMYMSLFVGYVLMCVVGVELILRQIITILGGGDELTKLGHDELVEAE